MIRLLAVALLVSASSFAEGRWGGPRSDPQTEAFVRRTLAATVKRDASATVALSALTLPHGLVRVIVAEQLYRAASLLSHHPYHRE